MNDKRAPSASETSRERVRFAGEGGSRSLIALSIFLALAAVALGIWGYREHLRASRLSVLAATPPATLTLVPPTVSTLPPTTNPSGWSTADLSGFESAFESGEYDRVRALFADNGVLTTSGNTHYAFLNGELEEGADSRVDGNEFRRLATLHGGQDLTILGTPVQVEDNTVAFGWRWSSGVSGTALLHLRRDGKILLAILNPSQARLGE